MLNTFLDRLRWITIKSQNDVPIEEKLPANEGNEGGDEPLEAPRKRARFQASKDADYQWNLPQELQECVKATTEYISEKTLKEKILEENSVPENLVKKAKKLVYFLKELLEEGKKKYCIKNDDNLLLIQEMVRNVFGPLSKIWVSLEEEKEAAFTNTDSNAEDSPEVKQALNNITWHCTLFEQFVTLIGQALNSLSCIRRHQVLSALVQDKTKVKRTLKEEQEIIDNDQEYLFGETFKENLKKHVKVKSKAREMIGALQPIRPQGQPSSSAQNQPFQRSPLPTFRGNYRGRGRGVWTRGGTNNFRGSYRGRGEKFSLFSKG